jgi:hypothetical protein
MNNLIIDSEEILKLFESFEMNVSQFITKVDPPIPQDPSEIQKPPERFHDSLPELGWKQSSKLIHQFINVVTRFPNRTLCGWLEKTGAAVRWHFSENDRHFSQP